MKKTLIISLLLPLLFSCSSHKPQSISPEQQSKDTNAFNILMSQFANNIETIWGRQEVLIAGPKDYVKYSDHYQTRSHINFDSGTITIETIASDNPQQHLQQAIVATLLMGDDPDSIDLYSDDENSISKMPFLYGQVLDEQGQPIRWAWRANHFADYLLTKQLNQRTSAEHTIWYVTIHLVANHVDKRAQKYLPYIRQAASRYSVDQSLILAIMQVESSFNPYAVSHADALGLMQVVRHTAGADVFKTQGKYGLPSRSYLLDPANNIDTGTAYLALLDESYLAGINNPLSRRYAVITAYNGGAGSVLRIFSRNKDTAFAMINRLSPEQVYQTLVQKHPAAESRNYLIKVNKTWLRYQRQGTR